MRKFFPSLRGSRPWDQTVHAYSVILLLGELRVPKLHGPGRKSGGSMCQSKPYGTVPIKKRANPIRLLNIHLWFSNIQVYTVYMLRPVKKIKLGEFS